MCTEKVTNRISLIHDRLVDALIQHGQQSNFFEKKKKFLSECSIAYDFIHLQNKSLMIGNKFLNIEQ